MRHWKPFAASLLLSLAALPASAQDATANGAGLNEAAVPAVLQKAVDDVIRPGYRAMHDSASKLTTAMKALCTDPSAASLANAQSAFGDTIKSWSRIEIVQTGPIIEKNRFEHILFYPDRKGVGLKQVQALIAKADEHDTTVEAVAGKSVALMSLTALEYVLYGNGSSVLSTEKQGFRCRYGAAVAGNIENTAKDIADEWDDPNGVQKSWKFPGKTSNDFMDNKEAVTALLGILVHGAANVRDQRLETFYKGDQVAARPKMAIYWRSANTWTSLSGNIEGLKTLWEKADMASLLPSDKPAVAAKIDGLLNELATTATTINPDIEAAIGNDAERAKIDKLLSVSRDLATSFSDEYGGAIGLSAGFSFADGD
ncbi:imelysin family protein [Rhizobium sp. CNPSo 3464]|uniref:imelysin family protein n=1 Tax=Rhizobium sp. CNPSo 3464 TaxID=3021406 RepID=UPI002550306B|nr:imelysin family protein [Rhizobium sp. CNPSo 3464]MDK4740839.1 imelysin family protein [Rhizobium sp. CNPSo 3464]